VLLESSGIISPSNIAGGYKSLEDYSNKVHRIKDHEGPQVELYSFFNLDFRWGGWVVNATPRPFLPPEKKPGTQYTGGWVGLRAGSENIESHQDSILGPFNPQRVAIPT